MNLLSDKSFMETYGGLCWRPIVERKIWQFINLNGLLAYAVYSSHFSDPEDLIRDTSMNNLYKPV